MLRAVWTAASAGKTARHGRAGGKGRYACFRLALALAYLKGDGVKEDPVLAARWSEAAAERGEPMAEYVLGTLYANGVHADPVRAFHWYSAAAAQLAMSKRCTISPLPI